LLLLSPRNVYRYYVARFDTNLEEHKISAPKEHASCVRCVTSSTSEFEERCELSPKGITNIVLKTNDASRRKTISKYGYGLMPKALAADSERISPRGRENMTREDFREEKAVQTFDCCYLSGHKAEKPTKRIETNRNTTVVRKRIGHTHITQDLDWAGRYNTHNSRRTFISSKVGLIITCTIYSHRSI
jgi:hypothetical protein